TPWATYIGFSPAVPGVEHLGVRLLGMVSLKGLDKIDVCELVPFAPGEAESELIDRDPLVMILRQDYHQKPEPIETYEVVGGREERDHTTTERLIASEIVICVRAESDDEEDEVLIGEWDPRSDDVRRPLRLPRSDFERLFS